MKKYAKDYTLNELLVVTTAKVIHDYETLIAGVGIPTLAGEPRGDHPRQKHRRHHRVGHREPHPRRLKFSVSGHHGQRAAGGAARSQVIMNDIAERPPRPWVIGGAQVTGTAT